MTDGFVLLNDGVIDTKVEMNYRNSYRLVWRCLSIIQEVKHPDPDVSFYLSFLRIFVYEGV